jgi:drug/metabolite transporter (DMT)-like permease
MKHTKIESIFLLTVLSIIWGSSFILMKKGLLTYSPTQLASMRVFFAGLVFVPIIIKQFKNIPWDKMKYIMIFAILELGIPPFLYTFAQMHIDSSTAGILNSLVPLFTLIVGAIMFKHKFHWMTISGVFVGMMGAFLMTFFSGGPNFSISVNLVNSWGLLIILATLMYGIAGNILKEYLSEVPGLLLTAISFVSLAIPAGIYLFTTDFTSIPLNNHQNLMSFIYIITLSVFGSALAIVIFSKLIQKSNALFASFVTYFIPFVSLIWGWIDGESISALYFFSIVIIFSGIYLANIGEKIEVKLQKKTQL